MQPTQPNNFKADASQISAKNSGQGRKAAPQEGSAGQSAQAAE